MSNEHIIHPDFLGHPHSEQRQWRHREMGPGSRLGLGAYIWCGHALGSPRDGLCGLCGLGGGFLCSATGAVSAHAFGWGHRFVAYGWTSALIRRLPSRKRAFRDIGRLCNADRFRNGEFCNRFRNGALSNISSNRLGGFSGELGFAHSSEIVVVAHSNSPISAGICPGNLGGRQRSTFFAGREACCGGRGSSQEP
jgi:hypothetical protein